MRHLKSFAHSFTSGDSPLLYLSGLKFALNALMANALSADHDTFSFILSYIPLDQQKEWIARFKLAAPAAPEEQWNPPSRFLCDEDVPCDDDGLMDNDPVPLSLQRLAVMLEKSWQNLKDNRRVRERFLAPFHACLARLAHPRRRPAADAFARRLAEARTVFKLNDCAGDCLTFIFLYAQNCDFRSALSGRVGHTPASRLPLISKAVGRPVEETAAELTDEAPLRRFGLLDNDLDPHAHIISFLNGLSREPLTSRYFHACAEEVLELDAYAGMQEQLRLLQVMIRNRDQEAHGINILFYGQPGTGKTSLARSLGKALGQTVYEINQAKMDADGSSGTFRYTAINACLNSVELNHSLIIVDEADEMLNSAAGGLFGLMVRHHNGDKGTVNSVMDQHRGVVVWITNDHDGIEPSTRRRFDYAIEFNALTLQQRRLVWHRCLEKHGVTLFSDAETAGFATRFGANAGSIELAARNASCAVRTAPTPEAAKTGAAEMIEKVMQSHLKLLDPQIALDAAVAKARHYSLEGLQVDGELPLPDIMTILRGFNSQLLDGAAAKAGILNMNLLMYGPPGSGKTEFARYVAREMGQPLFIRRASDLLDAYVGNTEKRIRFAFESAQSARAILFIDEADSLLSSRAGAVRSWEVSQVNELLSAMETFQGILLCATNFKDRLDSASLRRFNLKVGFDYLAPAGKRSFFQRILSDLADVPITPVELAELDGIPNLTPGDFKVVWQKLTFMPRECRTNRKLLDALDAEARCKNGLPSRRLGFAPPT